MRDFWIAECVPCKWEEQYTTEDSAIAAAENHVLAAHQRVPSLKRAQQRMGHVTQRTILDPQDTIDLVPAAQPPSETSSTGQGDTPMTPAPDNTTSGA